MADQSEHNEEDDYMGDLSMFLTSEISNRPSKSSKIKTLVQEPPKKKLKHQSWQDRRQLTRDQKQRQEDEKLQINLQSEIPKSNIGFKMLTQMGYTPGESLTGSGTGRIDPVGVEIRRSRAGIGRQDPVKEKLRLEEEREEMRRKNVEGLIAEFGDRKKVEWREKRVVVNFRKAKKVIEQLEGIEVVVDKKKDEDDYGAAQEEDEEEVITEEDLQDILMKLRDEHSYCLYCGCKYDSIEELSSNCPGIGEDDH